MQRQEEEWFKCEQDDAKNMGIQLSEPQEQLHELGFWPTQYLSIPSKSEMMMF